LLFFWILMADSLQVRFSSFTARVGEILTNTLMAAEPVMAMTLLDYGQSYTMQMLPDDVRQGDGDMAGHWTYALHAGVYDVARFRIAEQYYVAPVTAVSKFS
jgi:hypothetical protein